MKTDHYYVPVFLTLEGEIYVDYSIKNKKGKVTFKRIPANKFYDDPKNIDWEIKVEINFLNFYLQKNGLQIEDAPVEMLIIAKAVSDSLSIVENYYFTAVEKVTNSIGNDNFILLSLEDFLADKKINREDKSAIETFFNGDTPIKDFE